MNANKSNITAVILYSVILYAVLENKHYEITQGVFTRS